MVGAAGFEPATLWSQTRCATRLRYAPIDVLIHYILNFSKDKEHLKQGFFYKSDIYEIMIICCTSCNKKFEINSNLIPDEGRLLECSLCNNKWFFEKEKQINQSPFNENNNQTSIKNNLSESSSYIDELVEKPIKKKKQQKLKNFDINFIDLNKSKANIVNNSILNLILLFIISAIALIILIDTFKTPISIIIPSIEFFLYNFYESVKDMILFFKDLL